MSQASQEITQQFINGGVVPGVLNGQSATSKNYVDTQDAAISEVANNANNGVNALDSRVDKIVASAGNGNTEIVDARGNYSILSARLKANDANLSEKATKNELSQTKNELMSELSFIGNGSPKGTYATLSALQSAFPSGTTGIYIVTADGKWYFWNGTTWTIGGTYQSTGLASNGVRMSNLAIDIVNPITDYKKMSYSILSNQYYNTSGTLQSLSGFQCLKVSCSPGDRLRCNATVSGVATAMAIFYGSSGNFLNYINKGIDGSNTVYTNYEFIVPDSAYFVAIDSISSATLSLEKLQVIEARNRIETLESATSGYDEMSYSIVPGFYASNSGDYLPTFTDWQTLKVACNPGDKLRCTVTVTGGVTAMAVFFKSDGTLLSSLNNGTDGVSNSYIDYEFVVPANAYFVAIDGKKANEIKLEKSQIIQVMSRVEVLESKVDTLNTYWKEKTAVWFGTSIPAGGYPSMVAKKIGMTITNEAVGSSMARNGQASKVVAVTDPYGWTGLAWQNVAYSLSQTLAEKQYLIDNWATWKTKLVNNPPASLTQSDIDFFKGCSYENRLVSRHLGLNRKDLYIFDHGHNDNLSGSDINTMPTNTRNRGYFFGAMNYLIDLILADNPRARICFIGHYENARKEIISQAQVTLAEYWDFSLIELWKKLGWTQQTVTTTGYWGVDGIWVPSGGSSQTLTLTQVWMKDDLHPHSDASGTANDLIAETISAWLGSVR